MSNDKDSPYGEPRCEICKFSRAPGRCHRFPPQITFVPDPRGEGQVLYAFPKVWYSEWCGEFQLDQRAVDAIEASTKRSKP